MVFTLKLFMFFSSPSRRFSVLTIKPKRFLHLLNFTWLREESMSNVTEKLGIKIEKNPSEEKLTQLGVRQWSKYILYSLSSTHFTLILYFFFVEDFVVFSLKKWALLSFDLMWICVPRFCCFFTKKTSFTMFKRE